MTEQQFHCYLHVVTSAVYFLLDPCGRHAMRCSEFLASPLLLAVAGLRDDINGTGVGKDAFLTTGWFRAVIAEFAKLRSDPHSPGASRRDFLE